MALTQKQENFCLKFVECGNASDAYRHAYSTSRMKLETIHSKGYIILQKDEVRARIEELKALAQSEAVMTRQEALERLSLVARVKITDIAEFSDVVTGQDDNGNDVIGTSWRIKNSNELTPEAAASIKSVTSTKLGLKLELHDSMSAVQQLAKMQGWEAAQKFDHTSTDGSMTPTVDVSKLSTEALKELMDARDKPGTK